MLKQIMLEQITNFNRVLIEENVNLLFLFSFKKFKEA